MASFFFSFIIQESLQYEIVSSEKIGFQTLKNSEYGFSLDYPREWVFDESKGSDPVSVYELVYSGSDNMFFDVGVWRQSDSELNTVGIDYLNYMMEFEKDQCDNSIVYRNEECTDYRLESAEIVNINGKDAYQIKHSMRDSVGHFTEIVTDFKSPDYGFTIFASANTNEYSRYENDFYAAINSFELENVDMIEDLEQKFSQQQGGCLIATATYGSELAPQVQKLRELRDNTLLKSTTGSSFMNGFNQLYYSFSPTIADWERQNSVFKEAVKLTITPLLSSLSILNYVNMDSEVEVLGYGIGIIVLNIGMYFVVPVGIGIVLARKF